MKLFVMSDIHSFYNEMKSALDSKGFDINNPDHHLVLCGDLFDRGPGAREVFEFCKELNEAGRLIYIGGNHETLLFDCIQDIHKRQVGNHHITNGTIDTITQFTGIGKYDLWGGFIDKEKFALMKEVLDFIADNAVTFAEIGDYIFVHGWIPCDPATGKVADNWETGDWDKAEWLNGMAMWHKGARIHGKTIVCGHWNCSWGHSHLHQDRKEFPQKNRIDWQKSFEPFIDDGIIAIDACTAYTGFCNCLVLEI